MIHNMVHFPRMKKLTFKREKFFSCSTVVQLSHKFNNNFYKTNHDRIQYIFTGVWNLNFESGREICRDKRRRSWLFLYLFSRKFSPFFCSKFGSSHIILVSSTRKLFNKGKNKNIEINKNCTGGRFSNNNHLIHSLALIG